MFSSLQRNILRECCGAPKGALRAKGAKVDRKVFDKLRPVKIVTKSLERLIDRGDLVGYGVRTPKKWFIKEVKATRQGLKDWVKFMASRQKRLPL
ncbi:hypothetical protein EPN28_03865 [Patescibacteria group bacterium]|nr:MAG: hypothetical protein EPN28_03865 [Patescibacteria group bacterium]